MASTPFRRLIIDLRSQDTAKRSIREINAAFKQLTSSHGKPVEIMMRRVARHVEVMHIRPMIAELREKPRKRTWPDDYPIKYKSDIQRRKVMWLLNGKPYERSNKIVNGWGYKLKTKRGRISIEIENKVPEFKYVVGLIGTGTSRRSIRRYLKPMQPFHRITGWQPAHETVTKHIGEAKESAGNAVRKWLAENT